MSETKTLQQKLDENIPREVISTRSGGGAKALSYLETWYVIDRMNQVFGATGWSNTIKELTLLPGGNRPAYKCIVTLTVHNPEAQTIVTKEGVGYGSDKSDHNAHELAMKEASSDAFKVAAKNLGRSMGLALYDKSQEYVSDTTDTKTETKAAAITEKTETSRIQGKTGNGQAKGKASTALEALRASYLVIKAQHKITGEEFITKYTNGEKVTGLTEEQAKAALYAVAKDYPSIVTL